jgi:hypothetical protein
MTKQSSTRDKYLQRVYGITEKQYNQILKNQGDECAICFKPRLAEKKSFAVDHDHKTRAIRGLLCSFCNRRVIGRHRDPELFLQASYYLTPENFTGLFVPVKKKRKRRK